MSEILIGNYNELEVAEVMDFGIYLKGGNKKIFLPKKNAPSNIKKGDKLTVFVYGNSEGHPVATTLKPKATVEQFTALTVKEITEFGAFLDWGIDKDLFVPFKEMEEPMRKGKKYVVKVCLDHLTGRVYASSAIYKHLDKDVSGLKEGQKAELLVCKKHHLGYEVIIDNRFGGLLYANEIFTDLTIGSKHTGYIKKIREDGKIDVSLQAPGFQAVLDGTKPLLEKLAKNNGFLPLHDDSKPEEIKKMLGISKKRFKKIVGILYKEKKIIIKENGIYSVNHKRKN